MIDLNKKIKNVYCGGLVIYELYLVEVDKERLNTMLYK